MGRDNDQKNENPFKGQGQSEFDKREFRHSQVPSLEPEGNGYTGTTPYFTSDRSGKVFGGGLNVTAGNSSGFVSAGGYRSASGYSQGNLRAGANTSQNSQVYVEGGRSNTGSWGAGIGFSCKF